MSSAEVLPPPVDPSSDPPPLFDGTTRLYTSYICPFAQRVWITRNCKGLQEKIKLVPLDLENRPAWYKEKVYPENKVPALEHNNEIRGESLDLVKYVDSHFEGPALYPDDLTKKEFAEELLSYSDRFNGALFGSLKAYSENELDTVFNHLETALHKFNDGPFFLGQFSLVDIAYVPFIERFHPLLLDLKKYDITKGRPMLTSWIEEMNKIEGYKQTRRDPQELMAAVKKKFLIN
ncbi:Glutathione transferase [Bertholletia excelsa]